MEKTLLISVGAILGANARYWVGIWASTRMGAAFPLGTLIVNVAGCFLIGLINGLSEGRTPISSEMRLFATVGFLGAFTTFSSFGIESVALLREGNLALTAVNVLGNLLLGFAAVVLGLFLGRLAG